MVVCSIICSNIFYYCHIFPNRIGKSGPIHFVLAWAELQAFILHISVYHEHCVWDAQIHNECYAIHTYIDAPFLGDVTLLLYEFFSRATGHDNLLLASWLFFKIDLVTNKARNQENIFHNNNLPPERFWWKKLASYFYNTNIAHGLGNGKRKCNYRLFCLHKNHAASYILHNNLVYV